MISSEAFDIGFTCRMTMSWKPSGVFSHFRSVNLRKIAWGAASCAAAVWANEQQSIALKAAFQSVFITFSNSRAAASALLAAPPDAVRVTTPIQVSERYLTRGVAGA